MVVEEGRGAGMARGCEGGSWSHGVGCEGDRETGGSVSADRQHRSSGQMGSGVKKEEWEGGMRREEGRTK
jgi:hypothetical protein